MSTNNIEYLFISPDSKYYQDVVNLRYKVFYEPTNTPISGVYDGLEDKSYHLIAVLDNKVVGYIRLTIEGDSGQISQFVVEPGMRAKGNIAKKLFQMLVDKAKENNAHRVWGEIRLHVAQVAKIYGFNVSDEVFPSKKTGIPHRMIEKYI